ncbi:MAG: MTAP family purine nucleoside phosphorylase [Myxococcales bacterium]|nr:MTAP family purine nucleoside phosphorylase [Myxococcales bacterium]
MLGLIGGTGLGDALFGEAFGREHVVETPFGAPSSRVRVLEWSGLEIAVLSRHGEGHLLAPSQVPYRANVFALKALGVTHLIVSGAVGSLREEYRPKDLVLVDQVIDKTLRREPSFFDQGMAVHAELAQPYCGVLRERLARVARDDATVGSLGGARVHGSGTYVCMEGPQFSTVAEANMHRAWGGDLIGMTAMPEAKLAREAEMCCALVAFPTDYDCWRPHAPGTNKEALLAEIIGNLEVATANAVMLLKAAIAAFAREPLGPCACHSALSLSIWSDRTKIDPAHVLRYGPLVSKYLK